jgi:hypothetical protein
MPFLLSRATPAVKRLDLPSEGPSVIRVSMHFFTGALGKYPFRRGFVNALGGRVMYYSVCSFAGKAAHWEELVSNLAEERGVRAGCGCKLELRRFLDWENQKGC